MSSPSLVVFGGDVSECLVYSVVRWSFLGFKLDELCEVSWTRQQRKSGRVWGVSDSSLGFNCWFLRAMLL